ncbi:MAG: hypothetical protein HUU06_13950, partial [Planctomycetaceae bacterium]|nr:hypothetical protein [Planctomycetaceae bacterium]
MTRLQIHRPDNGSPTDPPPPGNGRSRGLPDLPSGIGAANGAWIEDLYLAWLEDPGAVHASWRSLFESLGDDRFLPRESVAGIPPDRRSIFDARPRRDAGPAPVAPGEEAARA